MISMTLPWLSCWVQCKAERLHLSLFILSFEVSCSRRISVQLGSSELLHDAQVCDLVAFFQLGTPSQVFDSLVHANPKL